MHMEEACVEKLHPRIFSFFTSMVTHHSGSFCLFCNHLASSSSKRTCYLQHCANVSDDVNGICYLGLLLAQISHQLVFLVQKGRYAYWLFIVISLFSLLSACSL